MSSYSNDIDSSFDDNDSYYENSQCYDDDSYPDDECSVESYSADSSPPLQISVLVNINININCPSNSCETDVNGDDSACDDNSDEYSDADDTFSCSSTDDSREEDSCNEDFQFENERINICSSPPEIEPPTKNVVSKITASHDSACDDDSTCGIYSTINATPV